MEDLTVVVPAYNAASSLADAVRSAQEAGAGEIIVLDDGSADDTAIIAEGLGCKVIRQSNSGAAAAREAGVREVRTPLVVLLDADDLIVSEGLEESIRLAKTSQTWAAVAGATLVTGHHHTSQISPWPEGITVGSLLKRGHSPGPPGTFLWSTQILKRAYSEHPPALRPRYAEDYEILIRGAILGDILCHQELMSVYTSEGGKSATAPLRSNSSAEDIRRYYSGILQIPIRRRGPRELRSMALLRTASASPPKTIRRHFLYMRAGIQAPLLFPGLALRKFSRELRSRKE